MYHVNLPFGTGLVTVTVSDNLCPSLFSWVALYRPRYRPGSERRVEELTKGDEGSGTTDPPTLLPLTDEVSPGEMPPVRPNMVVGDREIGLFMGRLAQRDSEPEE